MPLCDPRELASHAMDSATSENLVPRKGAPRNTNPTDSFTKELYIPLR